jgi:hypothetical protein
VYILVPGRHRMRRYDVFKRGFSTGPRVGFGGFAEEKGR